MSRNNTIIFARLSALAAAAAVGGAASSAPAQPSNIIPDHKYSWSENCGWMNWRDAGSPTPPNPSQGAFIGPTFLAGFIWGENTGWINLGGGTPANSVSYANTTGADSGVNRDPGTGALTGMAWGENVGWINFSGGAMATPPNAARLDTAATPHRLRGYAWGENIGWINLDDAVSYVGVNTCPADFNNSGSVSVQDLFDFLAAYFAGTPSADFNNSGTISVQDVFDFLAAYFGGCA